MSTNETTRTVEIVETIKVRKQVEIEFPFYSKVILDDSTIFIRTDTDLGFWRIHIRKQGMSYDGARLNDAAEVEFNPNGGTAYLGIEGAIFPSSAVEFGEAANTARSLISRAMALVDLPDELPEELTDGQRAEFETAFPTLDHRPSSGRIADDAYWAREGWLRAIQTYRKG